MSKFISVTLLIVAFGCTKDGSVIRRPGKSPVNKTGAQAQEQPAAEGNTPDDPGAAENSAPEPTAVFLRSDDHICPDVGEDIFQVKSLEMLRATDGLMVVCKNKRRGPRYVYFRVLDLNNGEARFQSPEMYAATIDVLASGSLIRTYDSGCGGICIDVYDATSGRVVSSWAQSGLSYNVTPTMAGEQVLAWTMIDAFNQSIYKFVRVVDGTEYQPDLREEDRQWCEQGQPSADVCTFHDDLLYSASPDHRYVFVSVSRSGWGEKYDDGTLLIDLEQNTKFYLDKPRTDLPASGRLRFRQTDVAQFSPDNSRLVRFRSGDEFAVNRGLKVFGLPDGSLIKDLGPMDGSTQLVGFAADTNRLVLTDDSHTTVFDADSGDLVGTIPGRADLQSPKRGLVWINGAVFDVQADDPQSNSIPVPGRVVFPTKPETRSFFTWRKGDCVAENRSGYVELFIDLQSVRLVFGSDAPCRSISYTRFNFDESWILVDSEVYTATDPATRVVSVFDARSGARRLEIPNVAPYSEVGVLSSGSLVVKDLNGHIMYY